MDDDANIVPGRVYIDVQVDGGRDVPGALDDLAFLIESKDVGGGQFAPSQLPRVSQVAAVVLSDCDVC